MTRPVTIWRVVGLAVLISLLSGVVAATAATADVRRTTRAFPFTARQLLPRTGPPYEATMLACKRSPRIDARSATVGAAMRPVPGARRLAVRIDLHQRALGPGGRWTPRPDVPGLGIWTAPSDPSIGSRANDVFKYRQAVGRLVVPYAYRFRVSFRWYDDAGAVVREETAFTSPCREPDLRPDVAIVRIDREPHPDPALERYVLLVRNRGRSTASNVGVGVASDAGVPPAPRRTIRILRAQEMSEVTLTAPRCDAGSEPVFVVDPAQTLDEADENDNALRATCPTLNRP